MSDKTVADLVVRAGTIRTMDPEAGPVTALAVHDGRIAATAGPGREDDLLTAWRGPATVVLDDPRLVVMPAFVDTHNHLMLAARNILGVPVSGARDIAELVGRIRERAAGTPPGRWVITAADWFTCPDDQLLELAPAATVTGGRLTYGGGAGQAAVS